MLALLKAVSLTLHSSPCCVRYFSFLLFKKYLVDVLAFLSFIQNIYHYVSTTIAVEDTGIITVNLLS